MWEGGGASWCQSTRGWAGHGCPPWSQRPSRILFLHGKSLQKRDSHPRLCPTAWETSHVSTSQVLNPSQLFAQGLCPGFRARWVIKCRGRHREPSEPAFPLPFTACRASMTFPPCSFPLVLKTPLKGRGEKINRPCRVTCQQWHTPRWGA